MMTVSTQRRSSARRPGGSLGPALLGPALLGLIAVAGAEPRSLDTAAGPVVIERVAGGLEHPWAVAALPDGGLLVTERPGRLRTVSSQGTVSAPLAGVPRVYARGQGGLMDVALHPDFAANRQVYLSFAEPGPGASASTALGRGRLAGDRIEGFEVIFRQQPKVAGGNHFGNRIVFSPQGHVFLTLGERFRFDPAQDLSDHLGTVVRLHADGAIPRDNPFVGRPDAAAAIWSFGHRNIEAAAIQPATGALWIGEMGPRGGDELNLIRPGANYGWPLVSWGSHYDGEPIPDPPTRPDLTDAVRHWTPVISPSGMIFYTGALFPAWRGDMLLGGLTSRELVRLELDGEQVTGEERMLIGARVRDLEQGADGAVYLVTDHGDGALLRLRPRR